MADFQDGTERTWNAYLDWCTYNNSPAFQKYITEGRQYANDLANASSGNQVSAKDNTNKNSITVNYYVGSDNVSYIKVGPFNWQFPNKLESLILTGNNGAQPSLKIFKADGTTETNVAGIETEKDFYVAFRADTGITSITKLEGKGKNSSVSTINANIFFLEAEPSSIDINPNYPGTAQKLILTETDTIQPSNYTITTSNIPLTISFSAIKVDENNSELVLPNVGFKFYNKESGKYLKYDGTNIQYVNTFEDATDFLTDENGKISLNNVLSGTYIAYETKNPNYGYVVDDTGKEITPSNGQELIFTNKQTYIRLTGLVWEDIQSEKMSVRNDLYNLDENDDADILMEGVKVSLKDRTTGDLVDDTIEGLDSDQRIVAETYTDENGEYQFDYVPIDNLENYYVEFEYDGLIYENVTPHLENEEKGSKAAEAEREKFNNRFDSMEKGTNMYQAVANQNAQTGNRPTVNYDIDKFGVNGTTLKMVSTQNTEIIATTDEADYAIQYEIGQEDAEIKNINLGLYKRPQTDLALQTEVEQIKAEINGYGHLYNYGPKYDVNDSEDVANSWNLGVRFESKYKGTYERPIYKADAMYENKKDSSKNLTLAITYKITLQNQGSVYGKINSISAYFDSRYNYVNGIGTAIDEQGNITGGSIYAETDQNYNNEDGYTKIIMYTAGLDQIISYATAPDEGNKVTEQSIYVQFNLPRDIIVEMLNEEETPENNLNFTAEINSYTSYSDQQGSNLYAAYDLDSVPNNATPGQYSTYEDDTDKASQVALSVADARKISGYVFEDTKEESQEQENVAEGNGKKDDDETNVNNVTVELIDITNNDVAQIYDSGTDTWVPANYKVDEEGNYTVDGFIPGHYQIRFTWGDGTTRVVQPPENAEDITVENYKSTIINYEKYEAYEDLENPERFYKDTNIVDGSSMALDDPNVRKQIDESLKEYNFSTDAVDSSGNKITQMPANTWTMEFPIEYDADEILSATLEETSDAREDTNDDNGHRVTFPVSNINFGIIRRPKQNIELTKSISAFKFTLPTGQTIIDATVNDDGTLSGATNYLSYMHNENRPADSLLRAEVDQNLMQGSTVDITYKIELKNISEADYVSLGYYNYGEGYYEAKGELLKNNDIVTLKPIKIVDYLSENSQYDAESNVNDKYKWKSITIDDLDVIQEVKNELKGTGASSLNLENYHIYVTEYFKEAQVEFNLIPEYYININGTKTKATGAENVTEVYMGTAQPAGNGDNAVFQNQAEVILVSKTGGGRLVATPGNYIPNYTPQEPDDSPSPPTTVIPSTGENRNYVLPISLIVIALITLGVGVYVIKVKVLGKK